MSKLPYIPILLLLFGCSSKTPNRFEATALLPESTALVMETEEVKTLKTTDQLLVELEKVKQRSRPEFKLGKGDILSVSVYGEPDISVAGVPIRIDGMVSLPLVGDVQAEGQTVAEVTTAVGEKLSLYIREPKVAVIVTQFNSLKYTISGEVKSTGVYPLATDVKLTEAIAKAGGFQTGAYEGTTRQLADLSHAYVARDGEYLPIDFVALVSNGDLRFDIYLEPGDFIFIPSGLSRELYVLGEVTHPDIHSFKEGYTSVNAIAAAGGLTIDADDNNIHIVRGSLTNPQLYILDISKVLRGEQRDVILKAGDIVYVPPTGLAGWNRILTKLIPSVQAIQTGLILQRTVR